MAVITVPRPLREKLGEEGTDALVALINEAGENNKQSVIEVVEERFERRLSDEISRLRVELAEEMSKLRVELAGEISRLRVELFGETNKLRAEMHDLRANLIQWMFVFWIGQIGVLIGLFFTFLRK
ncbi:MAG: hypothetical protein HY268_19225 [Deltaproteobacteria bacterium]|nr:hypothetical protein [Deltaproteobacteria bacterium]